MSMITPITGTVESSLVENQLKLARLKQENVRQTLESLHSQSNSLLLLSLQWKDLEDHFATIFETVGKKENEIALKLKQIEWKHKFMKRKLNEIESKERHLDETLIIADDRRREIDETYVLVGKCYETANERKLHYDEKLEDLRDEKHRLRRKFRKKLMKLESREKLVDSREKKLGFVEIYLRERLKEVESREKMVEDRISQLEKQEKKLEEKEEKIERLNELEVKNDGSYADIRLNVIMDGPALQKFLNNRVNDHEILRDEVIVGLSLSADPAKLVLDAMLGFYPEDFENEGLSVVRKSCVLLLEQLSKMKPRIRDHVRGRALGMAMEWKWKMNVNDVECYLEIVGFLQLVATYGLVCEFSREEISRLFEGCACHDQALELCKNLGLSDEIHDIIENLIHKQPLEAIMLAHAFELFDIFPPVPILKFYLSSTFSNAEKAQKNRDLPLKAQISFVRTKIATLDSVIRCIKKYHLESKYPIQPLEHSVLELKRKKLALTLGSSTITETESLTTCIDHGLTIHPFPDSSDASENSTSQTHSQASMREEPGHDSGHSLETGGSIAGAQEQNIELNKEKLALIPVSSRFIEPKSLIDPMDPESAIGSSPDSTDAFGNSTSSSLCRATMREVQSHDSVQSSETYDFNLGVQPPSTTRNKRPRLCSVISPEPAYPHLAWYTSSPVSYMGASATYGNYCILPTYSERSWRNLHHR